MQHTHTQNCFPIDQKNTHTQNWKSGAHSTTVTTIWEEHEFFRGWFNRADILGFGWNVNMLFLSKNSLNIDIFYCWFYLFYFLCQIHIEFYCVNFHFVAYDFDILLILIKRLYFIWFWIFYTYCWTPNILLCIVNSKRPRNDCFVQWLGAAFMFVACSTFLLNRQCGTLM